MVFLAPKRQAKVHETTRKLKSIEHTRQQTMLQFSFTWTWLNLSSSSSSFTKYTYTKEIRIVVYSSSEETTAKRSCLINVFPCSSDSALNWDFCIIQQRKPYNSGSKQERTEKCQTNSSSSFKIASSGRAASYKKVYARWSKSRLFSIQSVQTWKKTEDVLFMVYIFAKFKTLNFSWL